MILAGEKQLRCRELIHQTCELNDIRIIKGSVSRDHIHFHVSYPPKLSISEMMRKIKRRSAKN